MTRSTPSSLRALPMVLALVGAASCWPVASFAQSAPAPAPAPAPDTAQPAPSANGGEIRLSDEQRKAILESNTVDSAAAARGELTESERIDRGIHGEVGVMIGSYGTRGIYGTADIPLGGNAAATVSVESSRYGFRRR